MPRDGSGNYTLPAGNPVADGTIISTGWANPTMSDLGNEIQNSLDRSGRGGMLVPFQNVDGTVILPGITFTNEPGSGIYRAGSNDVRFALAGEDTLRVIDDTATPAGSRRPVEFWNGLAWVPVEAYDSTNVNITGGTIAGVTLSATSVTTANATITGGTINGTVIGGTTPAAGSFTTLSSTGLASLNSVSTGNLTATGTSSLTTVDIFGGAINNTTIGLSTAARGVFASSVTTTMPLTANAAGLGTTAGNFSFIQDLFCNTGNGNYIRSFAIRTAAGSSWTTAGLRMQAVTDSSYQGYIQYNGSANNGGVDIGVSADSTIANVTPMVRVTTLSVTAYREFNVSGIAGVDAAASIRAATGRYAAVSIQAGAGNNSWIFAGQNGGNEFGRLGWSTTSLTFFMGVGATPVGSIPVSTFDLTWSYDMTAVDFNATSDERLKTHITPITGALDKLAHITGCEFNWLRSGERAASVIAQAVEPCFPVAVSSHDDDEELPGKKTVSNSAMIALLVQGVNELRQQLAELRGA